MTKYLKSRTDVNYELGKYKFDTVSHRLDGNKIPKFVIDNYKKEYIIAQKSISTNSFNWLFPLFSITDLNNFNRKGGTADDLDIPLRNPRPRFSLKKLIFASIDFKKTKSVVNKRDQIQMFQLEHSVRHKHQKIIPIR